MASVVSCDDGKVGKPGQSFTTVACVLWLNRPIGAELGLLRIDGLEATSIIIALLQILMARHRAKPEALLLDSLTAAGFNVISPAAVRRLLGLPTVVIYTYRPSSERLEAALRKHFADWQIRMRVLKEVDMALEVETRRGKLHVLAWGMEIERARRLIESTQLYSRVPEPLRLAHMLASEAHDLLNRTGAGGGI